MKRAWLPGTGGRSRAGPTGRRPAFGDGARHKPAPGGIDGDPEQPKTEQRDHRVERRAEERFDQARRSPAFRGGNAIATSCASATSVQRTQRSFRATRALYQFMNSEMTSEMPR